MSRFSRSSGWIFPAILIGSVGFHLGFLLWKNPSPWVISGAEEPPLPVIEMVVIDEQVQPPEPEVEEMPPEEIPPPEEVQEYEVEEEPPPPLPDPLPEPASEPIPEPTPPPRAPMQKKSPPAPAPPKTRPPNPQATARPQIVEARPDTRYTPAPRYPESARREGKEGRVLVRAQVDTQGRVRGVSLARSSGVSALDQAALDAVRRWKFRPRQVNGSSTEAIVEVPVYFSLTR